MRTSFEIDIDQICLALDLALLDLEIMSFLSKSHPHGILARQLHDELVSRKKLANQARAAKLELNSILNAIGNRALGLIARTFRTIAKTNRSATTVHAAIERIWLEKFVFPTEANEYYYENALSEVLADIVIVSDLPLDHAGYDEIEPVIDEIRKAGLTITIRKDASR